MDWVNLKADENRILNKHFTSGRGGKKINKIVIHHNAGNLSIADCYNTWQTRQASAHYQVDGSGRIGQLVWDADTAWHAGDLAANQTSIGIEHANSGGAAAGWPISDATIEAGAHLVAALCRYYGLGRPQWRENVFPHHAFSLTACPVQLANARNAVYMARAQAWYDAMTKGQTSTSAASATSTGTADAKTATTSTTTDLEEVISKMNATHLVITNKGTIYVVDVLAGTYRAMPSTRVFQDTLTVLNRVGAKVAEWKTFAKSKSNEVENLAAFGTLAK